MNPYEGESFFGFFWLLIQRAWQLVFATDVHLYSDEIQVLALVGIAISSALVGSFLVLRKMSMLGNALSHTILLGILATFWMTRESIFGEMAHHKAEPLHMQFLLISSLAVGLFTAFLTNTLHRKIKLQEEASVGLVFTTLFALGISLATLLTRNSHIGTEVVMGSVDALQKDDLTMIWVIVVINLITTFVFYRGLLVTSFDTQLSKSLGFSPDFFGYLLMAQTAITVVGAFRAVGVLMVLAFLTGPILTARLLTHKLQSLILLAMTLGSLSAIVGVAFARHLLTTYGLSLSTGGIVVCVITLLFALVALFKKLRFLHH